LKNEEQFLVHCGMREFDAQGNTIQSYVTGEEGWVADNILLMKPIIVGSGGSIMIRREAFESVGGFDERLSVGEDWEFCYRVARKFKIGFVPEVLFHYRHHNGNAHLNLEKMERSVLLAYEKAFNTTNEKILRLRRKSYGNFYKILAGSYFSAGNYRMFIKKMIKSLWLKPSNIQHYIKFPIR